MNCWKRLYIETLSVFFFVRAHDMFCKSKELLRCCVFSSFSPLIYLCSSLALLSTKYFSVFVYFKTKKCFSHRVLKECFSLAIEKIINQGTTTSLGCISIFFECGKLPGGHCTSTPCCAWSLPAISFQIEVRMMRSSRTCDSLTEA